jgi:molybdopterin converting factor small subunit
VIALEGQSLTMHLQVLVFAAARDAAGRDVVELELPEPVRAQDVMEAMGCQFPQLAELLPSCRLAVDCEYVSGETPIREPDAEIALIPPVSGG